ncbi:hypothetical protein FRC07_000642 [Ceratobasidium sp. 392]|nr:hypothetical protein FRC07_000642 [Ceratobasidium sp. 392]
MLKRFKRRVDRTKEKLHRLTERPERTSMSTHPLDVLLDSGSPNVASVLLDLDPSGPPRAEPLLTTQQLNPQSTAWPGFETFAHVINNNQDLLSLFKPLADEFPGFIEDFEKMAQGRDDYTELRYELDFLFGALSGCLAGSISPTISPSDTSLVKNIESNLKLVHQKGRRDWITRYMGAIEDPDEMLEVCRRLQTLLVADERMVS